MKKLYFDIQKVDAEQRMVYGYASTEALDVQGEKITKSAISDALTEYMEFANIREMHRPSAVGVAKGAVMDEKGLYVSAHIVDDSAWNKVVNKVYKGFSVGGKELERDAIEKNTITKMRLSEISLVDRPANPDAVFDVFKADVEGEENETATETVDAATIDEPKETGDGIASQDEATKDVKSESISNIQAAAELTDEEAVGKLADYLTNGKVTANDLLKMAIEKAGVIEDEATKTARERDLLINKSMYNVCFFADILGALINLQSNVAWEAEYEKDGSTLAAQIKEWISTGFVLLGQQVTEEAAEAADMMKLADIKKDIEKAGAKFSKDTIEKLSNVHTAAKECVASLDKLGYVEKADLAGDIAKVDLSDEEKANDLIRIVGVITKSASDIAKKYTSLQKAPQVAKAFVKSVQVTKAQDIVDLKKSDTDTPEASGDILKADGTIDRDATALAAIKKAQQSPTLIRMN